MKIGGRAIGRDLVSKNGEGVGEGKKSKTHCIFNQKESTDHMIKRPYHMIKKGRSETDLKNDQRKDDRKPI